MTKETWRTHLNFPRYEVSDQGRVRSLYEGRRWAAGHIHVGQLDKNGYHVVLLRINGKRKLAKVHRLVATAFLGDIPAGMQVNHKNGHKADNRPENFEFVDTAQNIQHSYDVLGRVGANTNPAHGEGHGNARWKDEDIRRIRSLYASGKTQKQIAKMLKTTQSMISKITRREVWSHVL